MKETHDRRVIIRLISTYLLFYVKSINMLDDVMIDALR